MAPGADFVLASLLGVVLVTVAIAVRLGIHVGLHPGGVDTWYYLASAAALRRSRRLPISLPQYLLHDKTESYPPGFILFLSVFPQPWVRRYFWLVSPCIDGLHLLLLYLITLRLTNSLFAAVVAGAVYAVTPQLIAETRSLNPRAFGLLLSSIAFYMILRITLPPEEAVHSTLGLQPWWLVFSAWLVTALLFLTHTTTSIAFLVAASALTVIFGDWRYLGFGSAGLAGAVVLSGGFYLRVIKNHLHAIRFWRRNSRYRGAHPIDDSPIYGHPSSRKSVANWQAGGAARSAIRLLGENPFLVPMLLIATPSLTVEFWGPRIYWWALAILFWAFAVTFVRPLRVFGPGYIYMKASVFPTAFSLALVTSGPEAWRSAPAIIIGLSFLLSMAAIAVFYTYLRTRRSEHTSSTPPDLAKVASELATLGGDGILCLPSMYADFVSFASGKKVLWGGHSGDLSNFEAVFPVIRRPLDELIEQYEIDYVLLDLAYTDPKLLRLDEKLHPISSHGTFWLYRTKVMVAGEQEQTDG